MKSFLALALSGCCGLACTAVRAGEVIGHPSLNLTAGEVREVFLGEKQLVAAARVQPVDNSSAQADFAAKILQIDVAKYTSMWTKKAFREGLTAPPSKGLDAEVAAFVKSTPGAVGYVNVAPPGSHVLAKF
jgi:ABC-type phosphate transport system substrate-binding protein